MSIGKFLDFSGISGAAHNRSTTGTCSWNRRERTVRAVHQKGKPCKVESGIRRVAGITIIRFYLAFLFM